jgi:hypothetical protein
MVVATHIVKVRGTFDRYIWNENKLKKYVRRKIICEIDDSFHTHLELFKIDNDDDSCHKGRVDIWVYLYALPSEVDRKAIEKWIDDHIIEEGLVVEEFEFNMMTDTTENGWKERPFINMPWISFDDMDDKERKLCLDKYDEEWKKRCEIYKEYYSNKEERKKEEGVSHKYIKNYV